MIALGILGVKFISRSFPVEKILVSGNYHLEEDEIKGLINIRHRSIFKLSLDDLERGLKKKAWIKNVVLRKQFPDTIMVNVEEADPRALLSINERMFLIDTEGNVLEEIEDQSTPFLPVIRGIDPKEDIGGVLEAIKLITALDERNILSGKESIEIMLKAYGLVINMDGEYVKVGYGNYREKLGRWMDIEAEIRGKNIEVDYVDLRFENEIIVKPKKKGKAGKARTGER